MSTTTRKQPQDRKPKQDTNPEKKWLADDGTLADFVWRDADGAEAFALAADEITPHVNAGLLRRSRNDPAEAAFGILERVDRKDVLEVFDSLNLREYRRFGEEFGEYIGELFELEMGES